jgi:hypothetical protein
MKASIDLKTPKDLIANSLIRSLAWTRPMLAFGNLTAALL